jgi:hypothetical protein
MKSKFGGTLPVGKSDDEVLEFLGRLGVNALEVLVFAIRSEYRPLMRVKRNWPMNVPLSPPDWDVTLAELQEHGILVFADYAYLRREGDVGLTAGPRLEALLPQVTALYRTLRALTPAPRPTPGARGYMGCKLTTDELAKWRKW